ncbi:MAG: EAL domain-containing protein [Deltaproteobacteria bacterium]|nr:MAG: EAL domain-containing protein [Deltaproteobacteria bacterium]
MTGTLSNVACLQGSESEPTGLLIDRVTLLPTLPLLLEEMREMLSQQGQVGLLYVGVVQCSTIEHVYGWETFDGVIREVARCLVEVKESHLRQQDVVGEVTINGNALVLILSPPRTRKRIDYEDLNCLRQLVYDKLHRYLRERFDYELYEKFGCDIGCAIIEQEPAVKFERSVYRALEEACSDSILEKERDWKRRTNMVKDMVRKRKIRTVYQPIVDLHHKEVIGYEALSRGLETGFESPDYLFKVASEADAVWRLERLCRSRALEGASQLEQGKLLFLNVEPGAIYDPAFLSPETLTQMAAVGLSPERVVIELTEHTDVKDFQDFRRTLQSFKRLGFKVAIDDVGSGYAGLKSIAELRPDFIKMDMSLARDLHLDQVKQELVTTFAQFSERIGVKMILEGIESVDELKAVKRVGVRFAQGYHFALPDNPLPEVDPSSF